MVARRGVGFLCNDANATDVHFATGEVYKVHSMSRAQLMQFMSDVFRNEIIVRMGSVLRDGQIGHPWQP